MKLFNRMSRCIRTQSRKRPPARLSFDFVRGTPTAGRPSSVDSDADTQRRAQATTAPSATSINATGQADRRYQ